MSSLPSLDDYLEDTLNVLREKVKIRGLAYTNGDTRAKLIRKLRADDDEQYLARLELGGLQKQNTYFAQPQGLRQQNAFSTQHVAGSSSTNVDQRVQAFARPACMNQPLPTQPHVTQAQIASGPRPCLITPEGEPQSPDRPQISPSSVRRHDSPASAPPRAQYSPSRSPNRAMVGDSPYNITEAELEAICEENFVPEDVSAEDFPDRTNIETRWDTQLQNAEDKLQNCKQNATIEHQRFVDEATKELEKEIQTVKKKFQDKIEKGERQMAKNKIAWDLKHTNHIQDLTKKKNGALDVSRAAFATLITEKRQKWRVAFTCLKEKRTLRGLLTAPEDFSFKSRHSSNVDGRGQSLMPEGSGPFKSPNPMLTKTTEKDALGESAATARMMKPKRYASTPIQPTTPMKAVGNTTVPLIVDQSPISKNNTKSGWRQSTSNSPATESKTSPKKSPFISPSGFRALGIKQGIRQTSMPQPKRMKTPMHSPPSPSPSQTKTNKKLKKDDEKNSRSKSADKEGEIRKGLVSPMQSVVEKTLDHPAPRAKLVISAEDFKTKYGQVYTPYLFLSKDEFEVRIECLEKLDAIVRAPTAPNFSMFHQVVANSTGYFITFRPHLEGDEQARLAFNYFHGKELMGKKMVFEIFNCKHT